MAVPVLARARFKIGKALLGGRMNDVSVTDIIYLHVAAEVNSVIFVFVNAG